jgi:hypothetical protein
MPKINQAFSTVSVTLPSYKDSVIKIKTNLAVGEMVEAEKIEGNIQKSVYLASRMISEWNFEDEQGLSLAINVDNISQLPVLDLEFLLETITPLIQKKTVSAKTK